jgi:outer membrane murein-binding lipoprotein Lpp
MRLFQRIMVITFVTSLIVGGGMSAKRNADKKKIEAQNEQLQREIEQLKEENERLKKEIEAIEDWRVQAEPCPKNPRNPTESAVLNGTKAPMTARIHNLD